MLIDTDTLSVVIALYFHHLIQYPSVSVDLFARTPTMICPNDESVSCIFDFHAFLGIMQECM
jgi:hypothetical protein